MTKIKYIIFHAIFILFLNCNGSGSCQFFNKNKYKKNYQNEKESIQIQPITENTILDSVIKNQPVDNKKQLTETKKYKVEEMLVKKDKKIKKKEPEKTIPKATYVPYTNAPENIDPISPDYPKYELDNGIEGVVYIQFRIDTNGDVAESYIAKSSNNDNLDNAALNAVLSSKWQPAKNQGKLVSVWQTLPFEFKLSEK